MGVKKTKNLIGKSWEGSKIWSDKDSGGDEKNMVNNKNMKAVVLAAGEGTRIKLKIPKPLVRIDGLSLLERTILTLADLKVQELVIVVG